MKNVRENQINDTSNWLVIMILGVSYISASDEKRPQRWTPHTVNIQRIIKINNSVKL